MKIEVYLNGFVMTFFTDYVIARRSLEFLLVKPCRDIAQRDSKKQEKNAGKEGSKPREERILRTEGMANLGRNKAIRLGTKKNHKGQGADVNQRQPVQ
jgi:hypothetical protein